MLLSIQSADVHAHAVNLAAALPPHSHWPLVGALFYRCQPAHYEAAPLNDCIRQSGFLKIVKFKLWMSIISVIFISFQNICNFEIATMIIIITIHAKRSCIALYALYPDLLS